MVKGVAGLNTHSLNLEQYNQSVVANSTYQLISCLAKQASKTMSKHKCIVRKLFEQFSGNRNASMGYTSDTGGLVPKTLRELS